MSSPAVRRLADWDAARLRSLAATHGTPLYVYDLARVRANVARLREAFTGSALAYAVKANAVGAVLQTIAGMDLTAECASAGEVQRAYDAGFDRVRYTAVNPPTRDLDHVARLWPDHDLVVTAGALDTIDRLADRGFAGPLWVRVNPGVGAGHHAKVTTGAEPKFGVPIDRVADVVATARDRGIAVTGIHAHPGSGISGAEDLAAHRDLVDRLASLAGTVGPIETVCVGGGLGVPARPDEPPLDLDGLAAATRAALEGVEATLAIEPGRYLVADAGVLLTTVNTVKSTPGETVVGVDAGMTDLVRPAMYGAYHAIANLAPDVADRQEQTVTVAGPVCETADVFGRDRRLAAPRRGDILEIGTAGAYGYEMASNYNSRPRPAVVTVDGDVTRTAVGRETIADLTRLEER